MSRWIKVITLSVFTSLVGVIALLIPPVADLETDVGLKWLFNLRGPRPAPEQVMVVTIDQASSRRYQLPNEPHKWPRSYHADLVKKLTHHGARVIAFDIIFDEPRDAHKDQQFAEAIRNAGNVILFQYLKRNQVDTDFVVESLVAPIPELAEAAAALAPFPLPKVPARVSQAWIYKVTAGDAPTLPVVALQLYSQPVLEEFMRMLRETKDDDEILHLVNSLASKAHHNPAVVAWDFRQLFKTHPELTPSLLNALHGVGEPKRSLFESLISVYSDDNSRFLDFYGPPHSIHTVSYHKILDEPLDPHIDVRDKVVFVGFSEQFQPEQKDGFYTVFTQRDGLDVSGVEIAATTFANLLQNRSVEPLDPRSNLAVIILWGFTLGALFMLLPGAIPVPVAVATAALGLSTAHYVFSAEGIWLPLIVPLLFQLPIALLGALLWHYLHARKERHKIREAFSYFIPSAVVDDLIKDSKSVPDRGQLVNGVCLASDAEQYTRLSESLKPEELRPLLNDYYKLLFEPVKRHGGFVSDVVGDAMLAIWATAVEDPSLREDACLAALEIRRAAHEFRHQATAVRLPTRIGLHGGEMVLGSVGADDHYEYRAVGDIVNAAHRIESLNKQLQTRLLASSAVVQGLQTVVTRELGRFRLVGKSQPVSIHELVCRKDEFNSVMQQQHALFASGLRAFQAKQWQKAITRFEELLARFGKDGPALYYLALCQQYGREPPMPNWDGVISLSQK